VEREKTAEARIAVSAELEEPHELVATAARLLEVAVIDTLALENSVARSRTLAHLGQTALKCLEIGELEGRLALLEGAVYRRDLPPAYDFDLDLEAEAESCDPKELTP